MIEGDHVAVCGHGQSRQPGGGPQIGCWYNTEHRHSGNRYVTPEQRHSGQDHAILAARHTLYTEAKAANPARWSGHARNWKPVLVVTLNPERDAVINALLKGADKQPLAA